MKKLTTSLLAVVGLMGTAFAGHEVVSTGKDYKPIAPTPCFNDRELQVDVFGAYAVGEGPHQVGLFRDHGWGGGIGVNYFFTRNVGIGVDATWLYAKEASDTDGVEGDHTTIHNFTGSLIFRLPMDESCLAPYFFVGGGFHVDGEQWASAHAGVGIEYRIVPQKVGLFADGRWTYLGDRFGNDDLNFFSTRLGVRFVF
jgi:hypothetical protein